MHIINTKETLNDICLINTTLVFLSVSGNSSSNIGILVSLALLLSCLKNVETLVDWCKTRWH
jgi:hypothetical protein